jgi:prepilin-type N-terminal cleavage/methylation domain-containing protein
MSSASGKEQSKADAFGKDKASGYIRKVRGDRMIFFAHGMCPHQRKCRYNNRGMSLIEIIIALAMAAIFASSVVLYLGHLRAANTNKAAEQINTALNKLQVQTMSKAATPYLYIYQLSDGCYMKVLNANLTTFDSSNLDDKGTKLGNNSIAVYMDDSETGTKVEGNKFIKIVYTKASNFGSGTNVSKVVVKGSSTKNIRLIKETGKHFIE